MSVDPTVVKQKVAAAVSILSESSTTLERVRSAAALLKGINKKLDALASACEKNCAAIELATTGAYIELAASNLPEETEEQKKRKKYLLLFIKSWEDLKGEVARVQAELDQGHSVSDSSFWKSMLSAGKGPLAVITIVAVGIGVMSQTSVDIVIENEGCPTLYASGSSISIPGLALPGEPIAAGESATATIPPLTVTIDGTSGTSLTITSLKFNFDIALSSAVTDVTFDGVSLLGTVSEVKLSDKDSHSLRLLCS